MFKKNVFLCLSLLWLGACSSDKKLTEAVSRPPDEMVGTWTDSRVATTFGNPDINCTTIEDMVELDESGAKSVDLDVFNLTAEGRFSTLEPVYKTGELKYMNAGSVNILGRVFLSAEVNRELQAQLQEESGLSTSFAVDIKLLYIDTNDSVVRTGTINFMKDGKIQQNSIDEQSYTRVSEDDVKKAAALVQQCL